jgi:copper chaperone CopZ
LQKKNNSSSNNNNEVEKKEEEKSKGSDGGGKKEEKGPVPVVLKVEMHCEGCVSKIVKSVRALEGIHFLLTLFGFFFLHKQILKIISFYSVFLLLSIRFLFPFLLCRSCNWVFAVSLMGFVFGVFLGVETVKAEPSSNKLTVTGKIDPLKVTDYLHLKTKKQVDLISPQPQKQDSNKNNNSSSNKEDKKSNDKKPDSAANKPKEVLLKKFRA